MRTRKNAKTVLEINSFEAFTISSKESLEKGHPKTSSSPCSDNGLLISQAKALQASTSQAKAQKVIVLIPNFLLPKLHQLLLLFKGSKEDHIGLEQLQMRTQSHALRAFTVNNEGMAITSKLGPGYEEEISRGIFAVRERDAGNYQIPLYSRFKQFLAVSNASSIVFSMLFPSHDSDGELGTGVLCKFRLVTIATQTTQPQVPEPQQTVDPSCAQHVKTPRKPIRTPVSPSPIPSTHKQNWNQRWKGN
ncbi:hypothetical protein Tco_0812211 [Tanacetum coccineum]